MTDQRVSSAELKEADDARLAWTVIEPAFDTVDIYNGPETFRFHLQSLSQGQRSLLAIHWCISEVTNGGFLQFFDNPTAVVADESRAGFRLIGVPEAASVLQSAAEICGFADRPGIDSLDYDEFAVATALDALRARLEPLEERFYGLIDEAIYPAAAAYVLAHPAEFVQ